MTLEQLQMPKLQAYAFVTIVATFEYGPVNHLVRSFKSYMSVKHEVHTLSNTRIIKVFLNCHWNKVSMTASSTRYVGCPGLHIFQI